MRFVSTILKRVAYPSLKGVGHFHSTKRTGVAVITYHGVLPSRYRQIDPGFDGSLITADTFRRQLRLLKRNYAVISPEDMLHWCRHEVELPPRAALLTCDDGFLNNLTEMLPILQEEELRCLFFVTGASAREQRSMLWHEELFLLLIRAPQGSFRIVHGDIEVAESLEEREQRRSVWWNTVKRLSRVDAQNRAAFMKAAHSYFGLQPAVDFFLETYPEAERHFCLLTRAELQRLSAAGMTIGAHTMTHPILACLPPELVESEIVESRTHLENVVGKKIWALAYPFGDAASVTSREVAIAKQAGFEAAFLNIGGGLGQHLPPHAIPRVHVNAGMRLPEFEAHVSGFYEALQRWRRPNPAIEAPILESACT
jgi:peptidoglycan/xylan/chitin deacetylase (PgdA/CDA1 family)